MDRRRFLASAGAVAAVSQFPVQAVAASKPKGLSILQGITTETTTQLTVDVDRKVKAAYTLTDVVTKRVIQPTSLRGVTFGSSDTRVDKLRFTGLELGHKYQLKVVDESNKALLDDRFLSTVDLQKKNARIALMSCMKDNKSEMTKIWPSAEAASLDYMFFLGDSVYGDYLLLHGPSFLWSRYVETRSKIPYYRWKNLKPVIAIWDDHDFGKNNATGDYKYKDHSYGIFQTFFAQEPEGSAFKRGHANSYFFQAFGQNYAFFDGRYYRGLSDSLSKDAYFGRQQIDWMSTAIESNSNPTLIMQGSPFFGRTEKGGAYAYESPQEMEYFMDKVRKWNAPAVFVAGDLHYTEVSKLDRNVVGYDTYEIISSSMHSSLKSKFSDNPNERVNGYLKENFIVLEQRGNLGDPNWVMTCLGMNKTKVFESVLKIA